MSFILERCFSHSTVQPEHASGGQYGYEQVEALQPLRFVQDLSWNLRVVFIGNFVFVPAAFLLGAFGSAGAVYGLMLCQLVFGAYSQHRVLKRIDSWLYETGRHRYQRDYEHHWNLAVHWALPCASTWQWWLLRGLPEYYDPTSDASQAGRAKHALSHHAEEVFQKSWRDVPVLGQVVINLQLSGVLTLLVCFAMIVQIFYCCRKLNVAAIQSEHMRNIPDRDRQAPRPLMRRASIMYPFEDDAECEEGVLRNAPDDNILYFKRTWYDLANAADAGSAMLLADVFHELAKCDAELLLQPEWQFLVEGEDSFALSVSRETKFETKIVCEGALYLWFQVSLLALSYDTSSFSALSLNLVSIIMSLKTILSALPDQLSDMRAGYLASDVKMQYKVRIWLMGAIAMALLLASIPRLVGVWICPSHVLNLRPQPHCVEPFNA